MGPDNSISSLYLKHQLPARKNPLPHTLSRERERERGRETERGRAREIEREKQREIKTDREWGADERRRQR